MVVRGPGSYLIAAAAALGLCACGAGSGSDGAGPGAAGAGAAGTGAAGARGPGAADAGGANAGGAGAGGRGGAGGGAGAAGAGGGGAGARAVDGSAGPMPPPPDAAPSAPVPPVPPPPPPPGEIQLVAIPSNGTIGLDWTRDSSARGYRIYWSTSPGVTPQTGQRLDSAEPAFVHRGLANGMRYHYVVTVVTDAGEGKRSNEAQATPAGEWVLEELGAGDFADVLTGGRVRRLPVEARVHVLLLGEGYLAGELPILHDHARHNLVQPTNDVDRWIQEVFALDPYSKFREAFVIWYLPRASAAHIGAGTTAFGSTAATAAPPLWAALDNAGSDAFLYPPAAASRNHVASFLLFDPARGRAGVSGFTSSCPNPANRNLTIPCAFGIGHAHEFTHAFSNVRDEYLEDNTTNTRVADPWSNVNGTNRCGELPWAHLLHGRGINTASPELVGAFGRPQRGFHSELKCQMNGTHENGSYWCAPGTSLTLRVNRFCNFCRELTTFRVFYRTGILQGTNQQAFDAWRTMYRMPFFARYPFAVPAPVPQTLRCPGEAEKAVYEACVP